MRYYLGLGSNLVDPRNNLARARRRLAANGIKILKTSSLYRTEPVGLSGQPWFLNQAVLVETSLSPWQLLRLAQRVESEMGRIPGPRNAPRVIDIDILLAGDTIVDTPSLTVPHPRLAERNFVLVPLAEIAPRAVHPLLKKTIRTLRDASPDRALVEKAPSALRPDPATPRTRPRSG
jgi:2-amino-4-hydroxy-6-hydroxymethyldihydropteridine diphosphokinase